MIRNVLSVLAGIVIGNILILLVQFASHAVSPKPKGFDPDSLSYLKELVDLMPWYLWALIISGYIAGTGAGGFVVEKIAESKSRIFPVILGVFFMLGWLINITRIPHPLWVVVVVFAISIPCALAGHKLAGIRRRIGQVN